MKPGSLCVPNCLLNRSTQKKLNAPQDGVSALAAVAVASVLTARTPPTMVSDAAVASTLLLMDMNCSLHGTQPYPAHGWPSWPPQRARRMFPDSPGTLPARGGLIGTGNGLSRPVLLFRKGKTRADPVAQGTLRGARAPTRSP